MRARIPLAGAAIFLAALTAAHAQEAAPAASSTSAVTGSSGVDSWEHPPIAPPVIPVGDGKVASNPAVGYVDSCTRSFRVNGALHSGPWLDTVNGTWDATSKPAVLGDNSWPSASHSFTVDGTNRVLRSNGLPQDVTAGNFPIARSDPAYQYDRNPNAIQEQSLSWSVPANPTAGSSPSCTTLGEIGVMIDGVPLFNALDDAGRDAGAHEIQDDCDGHPNGQGMYHYHSFSACLASAPTLQAGSSALVGYALDGYGIFVERDASANLPTDADLDECHGRTSGIQWDGQSVPMYHYDVTLEYPYTLGCFHGSPVSSGPRRRIGRGRGR